MRTLGISVLVIGLVLAASSCKDSRPGTASTTVKCKSCSLEVAKEKTCSMCGACAACDKCPHKCANCKSDVKLADMCAKCGACKSCDKCAK